MTCGETPQGGRLSPELSVLVVTYFFPPDSEVGGKRMARFCRYLPEFGVRPVVLTVKQDYAGEIDNSFATPSGLQIERTPVLGTPLTGTPVGSGDFAQAALPLALNRPVPQWLRAWLFAAQCDGSVANT